MRADRTAHFDQRSDFASDRLQESVRPAEPRFFIAHSGRTPASEAERAALDTLSAPCATTKLGSRYHAKALRRNAQPYSSHAAGPSRRFIGLRNVTRPLSASPPSAGFNLLEVLIAMTVLVVIVTLACAIFTHSDEAWSLGTGKAGNLAAGRAAINMIARDLQQAVADEYLTFAIDVDRLSCSAYGFPHDEISFVSLQNDCADSNRAAREIFYWVRRVTNSFERYELVRGCRPAVPSDTNNCYLNPNWHDVRPSGSQVGVVAENVAALGFTTADGAPPYYSGDHSNRLPEYVDVFLEVLDERAVRQAAEMPSPRKEEFVERNIRRYTTRVYFCNRDGYKKR